jgi:predicted metalloprotease
MRWSAGGRSSNLQDERGSTGGGGFGGGGGGFGRGMGLGGTVILLILSLIFGRDFISGSGDASPVPGQTAAGGEVGPAQSTPEEERAVDFTSAVLDSVQNTWQRVLPQQTGRPYQDAKLVLYRDAVRTGCGTAPSAVGPFYCPMDQKVYIDLSFYDELRKRFGAPGDFAQAYVIAHELGHHVQHLLGTDARVRQGTRCRCASSSRPTATPACGRRTTRTCSRRATWTRRSPRPPRSVTTGCSARRAAR